MILGKSTLPSKLERPKLTKEPLADHQCYMWGMSASSSPKEFLKRVLEAQKKRDQKKLSERDILDNMDKLRNQSDEETDDILYALSDIGPSEGIRRKARDMIAERKR